MVSFKTGICIDCKGQSSGRAGQLRCRRCAVLARSGKARPEFSVSARHKEWVGVCPWGWHSAGYATGKPFGPKGIQVLMHRYVWWLEHGEWPSKHLDHINRNRLDNRIENLRLATSTLNQRNSTRKCSGLPGVRVYRGNRTKKFQAVISRNGFRRSLGYFASMEEAAAQYENARQIIEEFEALESLD